MVWSPQRERQRPSVFRDFPTATEATMSCCLCHSKKINIVGCAELLPFIKHFFFFFFFLLLLPLPFLPVLFPAGFDVYIIFDDWLTEPGMSNIIICYKGRWYRSSFLPDPRSPILVRASTSTEIIVFALNKSNKSLLRVMTTPETTITAFAFV